MITYGNEKFRALTLGVLMSLSLSGCIPAAFVAGASATGAIVYDKRSLSTMVEDRDMSNAALKAISRDPQLKDQAHITIASFNHVMLLAGQAPTDALRDRAYQIASAAPNVKRIYNQVTVEEPLSKAAQAKDTWITTKVKSAILAQKGLNSSQIKVVTENKVVYLMGILTPKQADIAADVASKVAGVEKVVKIFEYEQ
ncbi:MAG TPA: BON domain-containing protein [Gammaproteobacteria bacterium]|nr:BON domain-containing protein [Gammaproteobacteria bacterium]